MTTTRALRTHRRQAERRERRIRRVMYAATVVYGIVCAVRLGAAHPDLTTHPLFLAGLTTAAAGPTLFVAALSRWLDRHRDGSRAQRLDDAMTELHTPGGTHLPDNRR